MATHYDINTRTPNASTVYVQVANGVRAESYLTNFVRNNFPDYTDADVLDTVRRVKDAGMSGVFISRRDGLYFMSADAI